MTRAASLLTYPGLALHIAMQWILCRMLRLAVFRPISWISAEILHEPASKARWTVLKALLPATCLFLFGVAAACAGGLAWNLGAGAVRTLFFLWFGASLLSHGFPSGHDAQVLRKRFAGKFWLPPLAPILWVSARRDRGLNAPAGLLLTALAALPFL